MLCFASMNKSPLNTKVKEILYQLRYVVRSGLKNMFFHLNWHPGCPTHQRVAEADLA